MESWRFVSWLDSSAYRIVFIQNEKKLTSVAFNTLLNLIVHWWSLQEWPHPSMESLAIRMGVSVRTVQRAINDLEKLISWTRNQHRRVIADMVVAIFMI